MKENLKERKCKILFLNLLRCLLLILPAVFVSGSGVPRHVALLHSFGFEVLIRDANVLSHIKPLCLSPGGCVTECLEGPLFNDAAPPPVNIEGRDEVFPHVLRESKLRRSRCV